MSRVERFVGIVGLPRSGTTLLTALLDAHPRFFLYYEPWNASKRSPPGPPANVAEFCSLVEERFGLPLPPEARVTGFKETSILPGATAWASQTLENVSRSAPTHAIWIFRDPIHCHFSKVDAARRWWGHADARFSRRSLEAYLRDAGPCLVALDTLVRRHHGTIVSYEALVSEPGRTLAGLMAALGEELDPAQLEYHKAGPQPRKVMGDVEVARDPAPVSAERLRKREREFREHAALIEEVLSDPEFAWIAGERERLARLERVSGPPWR